jgi:Malectin domain
MKKIELRSEEDAMNRLIEVLSLGFLLCLPAMANAQTPAIRVKCGGPAYTDSKGQAWSADFGFSGGEVSSTLGPVKGTADPKLFQDGRWSDSNSPALTYTFPVADGSYHVNLYFAELYPGDEHVGARVANIKLQGTTIFQNLDVFAAVGANTALIKGADIAVTNGSLQIELDNVADHAKIEAIEIVPNSAMPQLQLHFVYPDGTPVAGTLNYTIGNSTVKLGGAAPLTNGEVTCDLFTSPDMMGLLGQFQLTLGLSDTTGHTIWQIVMTMNPTSVNFGTVQSSTLTVVVQKS